MTPDLETLLLQILPDLRAKADTPPVARVEALRIPGRHIVGGPGDETIPGGSGNDTIEGDGGHDSLQGRGGDDELRGGAGDDTLNGGSGDDRLSADERFDDVGADLLIGGAGNDTLIGYDDTYRGGRGDDEIHANGGEAFLGDGDDTLRSFVGADGWGGSGDDLIGDSYGDCPGWVAEPPDPAWNAERGQVGRQEDAEAQDGV